MTARRGTLDIDVGNSRVKWRCTNAGNVRRGVFDRGQHAAVADWRGGALKPSRIRVGSVASAEHSREFADWLAIRFGAEVEFAKTTRRCGGLTCGYQHPERMGVDRWLAMLGAWQKVGVAFVAVDVGTAATVDVVDPAGFHRGGYIVPGPTTMIDSLTRNTARVKVDATATALSLAPGLDTDTCVQHGVNRMFVDWVQQTVARFRRDCDHGALLIVTGGGAPAIAPHLAIPFRWEPELVLDGLALACP